MTATAVAPAVVSPRWDEITATSRTTLTTHLWTAPPLRRGSPVHDAAFAALRELRADLVRFLPWFSHPRISVPALAPPTATTTSWDFALLDPFVEDFMAAAEGRPVVANFATIPAWMFATDPVHVADDPDVIHWDYEQAAELRDETLAEVADYFFRVASWYIDGGFTDELGVRHESGHRYRFAYWEVLCEPDLNHRMDPATYTRLYDAVVERLRPLDPEMRFVGLSLSEVHGDPEYWWAFLDPARHADGAAPDAFSFHFYARPQIANPFGPEGNPPAAHWPDVFHAQADAFLGQVRLVDSIRRRLAPACRTFVNEIGSFPPDVMNPEPEIPDSYWALAASVQTYLWSELVALGVDLVGVAEFMDYPGMIPGTTLVDWETGAPNQRYRALELLLRHFGPGDALVATQTGTGEFPDQRLHARAFVTAAGQRALLVVNRTADPITVTVDGPPPRLVDHAGAGPAELHDALPVLDGYGIAVLTW